MLSFDILQLTALLVLAALGLILGRSAKPFVIWLNSKRSQPAGDILDSVPTLLWNEVDDKVTWANSAFRETEKHFGKSLSLASFNVTAPPENDGKQCRASLTVPGSDKALYFDIFKQVQKKGVLYSASSAKAIVEAEEDRARFVQTLSDTFAHLPIGMAVFDKERDLSLFNPALSELLDLSALWLANKPSLREFLDRLHDKGALPEPRNFKSWRDQIVEMEKSAKSGTYFDDWHMPNDKVFRVTGRPHPKGAVAFIFEDITRSVSTEREYRIEIERLYATLDQTESGIIIFDGAGTMSFANRAFDALWRTELSEALISPSVVEVAEIWNERSEPTPVLGEIKDFIMCMGERANWTGDFKLKCGLRLAVRINSLLGSYSMIEFLPIQDAPSSSESLKQSA